MPLQYITIYFFTSTIPLRSHYILFCQYDPMNKSHHSGFFFSGKLKPESLMFFIEKSMVSGWDFPSKTNACIDSMKSIATTGFYTNPGVTGEQWMLFYPLWTNYWFFYGHCFSSLVIIPNDVRFYNPFVPLVLSF